MFRGLSIATKLLQLYMSGNEGSVYLKSTVLKLVHDISSIEHSLEVNPKMAEKGIDVNGNLNKLLFHAQRFLELIISSAEKCPVYVIPLLPLIPHLFLSFIRFIVSSIIVKKVCFERPWLMLPRRSKSSFPTCTMPSLEASSSCVSSAQLL